MMKNRRKLHFLVTEREAKNEKTTCCNCSFLFSCNDV